MNYPMNSNNRGDDMTIKNITVPIVIEGTGREERSYDIFSRLMKDRIIFLGQDVNDYVSNIIVGQMLFLAMDNRKKEIQFYINSPGGSVTAGLAIYDTMQFIECDVATYCVGQCASMAAILLGAGAPGKRYALPNSRVMVHQPWGGAQGTASDISIHAEEILKMKKRLNEILSRHTGQDLDEIEKLTDRDYFMGAHEAHKFGLIDEVIERKESVSDGGEE